MIGEPEGVEAVRRIWCAVLDLDDVESDAGFFEVGGQSMLILVLQEHLEQLVGRPIPIEELFYHSTVRAQATLLFGSAAVPAARPGANRERLLERRRGMPPGPRPGEHP